MWRQETQSAFPKAVQHRRRVLLLGYLAGGMSEPELLAGFPQLTRDDVRACLAYAAERERRTLSTPAA